MFSMQRTLQIALTYTMSISGNQEFGVPFNSVLGA